MNLLSLMYRDYQVTATYNKRTTYWEIRLSNKSLNDNDGYDQLTKIDMEVLRDNAKRLYEAIDKAINQTETVDFPMKPRLPCNHPTCTLEQIQGEPMVFRFTCPECESKVQIMEGKMELLEDSISTRNVDDGLQSRGQGKE